MPASQAGRLQNGSLGRCPGHLLGVQEVLRDACKRRVQQFRSASVGSNPTLTAILLILLDLLSLRLYGTLVIWPYLTENTFIE